MNSSIDWQEVLFGKSVALNAWFGKDNVYRGMFIFKDVDAVRFCICLWRLMRSTSRVKMITILSSFHLQSGIYCTVGFRRRSAASWERSGWVHKDRSVEFHYCPLKMVSIASVTMGCDVLCTASSWQRCESLEWNRAELWFLYLAACTCSVSCITSSSISAPFEAVVETIPPLSDRCRGTGPIL